MTEAFDTHAKQWVLGRYPHAIYDGQWIRDHPHGCIGLGEGATEELPWVDAVKRIRVHHNRKK